MSCKICVNCKPNKCNICKLQDSLEDGSFYTLRELNRKPELNHECYWYRCNKYCDHRKIKRRYYGIYGMSMRLSGWSNSDSDREEEEREEQEQEVIDTAERNKKEMHKELLELHKFL